MKNTNEMNEFVNRNSLVEGQSKGSRRTTLNSQLSTFNFHLSTLVLIVFCLFFASVANAQQVQTMTIGSSGGLFSTGNSSTGSFVPGSVLGNTYCYRSLTQFIYTASEMGGAKTIKSVAFYHNNGGTFTTQNLTIYLAHTASSTISGSTAITSGTAYYTGTSVVVGGTEEGWQTFELDTDFEYNGTDNLLVVVARESSSGYKTAQGWQYTSTSSNYRYIYRTSDNSGYGTLSNGNSTYAYTQSYNRPNIQIGFTSTLPFVTLSPSSATVLTGFTQSITASYGNVSGTPTITYTSSNASVATVSGSGTTATVTAVAPGTCTITATMTYQGNNYTATCAITVEDPSYCEPSFSNPSDDYISNFATSGGTTNINNTSTYVSGGYSDYYNNNSVSIEAGATLTCTVTSSSTQWNYGHAIWVDWNKDYEFTSEERVAYTSSTATGNWTGSFVVPANIAAGDYRMRVIHLYNNTPTDPCMSDSYGEAEDYKLTVIASGAYTITCATPTNGTLSADRNNADENDVITITATPETDYILTALTFTPEGGSAQNISIASMPYTFTMPAANVTVNATFSLPACPKPTNVTVSNIVPQSASVSWNGSGDSYEMEYAEVRSKTYNFDDGTLQGWTNLKVNADGGEWLNSNDNPGGYDYTTRAHSATGFALSYSFIDNVGAYATNVYLVSPQRYQIGTGASLNFWYNFANSSYPDNMEVCVATVANPTASDFSSIWSSSTVGDWTEVNISLNTYVGQSIWIAFHHEDEDMYEIWVDDITVNYDGAIVWIPVGTVDSPYTLTGLDSGTEYMVHVLADCGGDGESSWSSPVAFTTLSACTAPIDLSSTDITATSATLSWSDYQDSYIMRYMVYSEDFEEGIPDTWTTIDADGDGNNWLALGEVPTTYPDYSTVPNWAHNGSNAASSPSYANGPGAFNSDHWLISPQIDLGGFLKFYAASTNDIYLDRYEVLLSTTGTATSDFNITLQAMSPALYNGYGWTEVDIDLSNYSGQGYIAIHHVSEDMYFLIIDDFSIWKTFTVSDPTITINQLTPSSDYVWQVRGANCDGSGSWSEYANFTTLPPTKIRNTNPAYDEMTWEQFAGYVNGGYSYAGQTVTLMEDISVTTMVGTDAHRFCGTFDGDGKTITANISSSEQGAAPFRYISGATIQNLVVAGTVTSTAHHASGLVGFCADGSTNTIQNCHISTNVSNSNAYNGDGGNNYMGGLIGHNMSATTSIIGCVYDGTITSQGFKGGMVGFGNYDSNVTITDSYFAGAYSANGYSDPNFSPISCHGAGRNFIFTFSNFYYNTDAGDFTAPSYEGTVGATYNGAGRAKHAYSVTGVDPVTVGLSGNHTDYSVSGISAYATGIVYNSTIYAGAADVVSLTLSGSSSGNYTTNHGTLNGTTLTMEGYDTEISVPLVKIRNTNPAADEMTWEQFAEYVSRGCSYTDLTVTLMEDITVTTMVGANGLNFCGTFDGGCNTITFTATVTQTEESYQYTAPFRYIRNATIQNLKVAGSVTSSNKFAGGIVGRATGNCTIVNCINSTVITATNPPSNNGSHGGIVGQFGGTATGSTIRGCVFNGQMIGANITYWCGILGYYGSNSITIENCLFIPASVNISANNNNTICREGTATVTNCYYTQTMTNQQGTRVYSVTGGTGVEVSMKGSASTTYSCSGLDFYTSGLTFNGTIYGSSLALSLGYEGLISGYTTSNGELSGSSHTGVNDEYTLASLSGNAIINQNPCPFDNPPAGLIWKGGTDGDITNWEIATNWAVYNESESRYQLAGSAPSESSDVFIVSNDACNIVGVPSLSSNEECNDITLNGIGVNIADGKYLTVNGTATFTSGIVTGDVTFGSSAKVSGASTSSHVDGIVKKNGAAKSTDFYFPTGSNGNLGKVVVTDGTATNVSVQYFSNPAGFSVNDLPRWWASASVSGFDHVSNVEYWKISSTDTITANFIAEASTDMHFNSGTAEEDKIPTNIQMAFYDNNHWTNVGGSASIGNNMLTITGAVIPASTTRGISGNYTTFGSKTASTVLPIELTSFTATCDGRSAHVEWTTASERNNDYFSLERSDDAINFTEIARVAGAGNSIEPLNYSYTDYGIHGGDNYYRLVQVDYDGTRTVSDIVVANCVEAVAEDPEVLAYPNPFNGELTLVLDNFDNRAATIEVYDMLGKQVFMQKADAPQNSYETILNLSNLPSGAYTVRVSTTDFVINKNVVKN